MEADTKSIREQRFGTVMTRDNVPSHFKPSFTAVRQRRVARFIANDCRFERRVASRSITLEGFRERDLYCQS